MSESRKVALAVRLTCLVLAISFVSCQPPAPPPNELEQLYPRSPVIERVLWQKHAIRRAASGSDLWAMTWADDDNLYASWGDGGGFGGGD
jgi:hypothetical protein